MQTFRGYLSRLPFKLVQDCLRQFQFSSSLVFVLSTEHQEGCKLILTVVVILYSYSSLEGAWTKQLSRSITWHCSQAFLRNHTWWRQDPNNWRSVLSQANMQLFTIGLQQQSDIDFCLLTFPIEVGVLDYMTGKRLSGFQWHRFPLCLLKSLHSIHILQANGYVIR